MKPQRQSKVAPAQLRPTYDIVIVIPTSFAS